MTANGRTRRKSARLGTAPWGAVGESNHRRLASRMLRREFRVSKEVRRATAYVCGLGFFDLHLNGKRVGDSLMNPALTGYDRRACYVTFDVTRDVQRGRQRDRRRAGQRPLLRPAQGHPRADDELRLPEAAPPAPPGIRRRLGGGRGQRRGLAADRRRPDPCQQRIRRRGVRRPPGDAGVVEPRFRRLRLEAPRTSSSPPAGRSRPR